MLYNKIELFKRLTYVDGKYNFDNFTKGMKWANNGFIMAGKLLDDFGENIKDVKIVSGYDHKSEDPQTLRFARVVINTPEGKTKEYIYDELYKEFIIEDLK